MERPSVVSVGKTLNTYRELAVAMNLFPENDEISIRDLADKANVHYNTAKKAILFFQQLRSVVPKFEIEETGFRIISKPNAMEAVEGIFESLEMRVLTKMMLVKAVDPDRARKLDDILKEEERSILPSLIERGFVNSMEGLYFLSTRGQSLGSMGLRRLVELDIPLPWERPTRTHPETSMLKIISYGPHDYSKRVFPDFWKSPTASPFIRKEVLSSYDQRKFYSACLSRI